MKRVLLVLSTVAVLALTGCSDEGDTSSQATGISSKSQRASATTTTSASSPSATSSATSAICDEYCTQVEQLSSQKCAPGASGGDCAATLTDKVLLVMQIQNDDDGSDAAFTAALQDVVDEGEEFGTAGCAQQAQLDAACGISALNVDTSFDIVAVRLGIL